jgi:uncharacterized membrane protein
MKRSLGKDDLKFLSERIAEAESNTSGEIRVVLRHRRHWGERSLSLHDLALREFYRLGMDKTTARTGILILLLRSDQSFQIIADQGIHAKVEDGTWDAIARAMSDHFRSGRFREGLTEAISSVGSVLSRHFPKGPGGGNQLPNEIIEE